MVCVCPVCAGTMRHRLPIDWHGSGIVWSEDTHEDMYEDACVDILMDTHVDILADILADTHMDIFADACMDVHMDAHVDILVDSCVDVRAPGGILACWQLVEFAGHERPHHVCSSR